MWPQFGPHEVASTDLEDDIHFQPILQDIADYAVVLLRADNQANIEKSTYHKQPWMVWGTKTQNSGDRPSRKNKEEEFHETY